MENQMEYEKKLLANANPGDDMKDMFAASKQTGLQVMCSHAMFDTAYQNFRIPVDIGGRNQPNAARV
jgi:hypothetical protein